MAIDFTLARQRMVDNQIRTSDVTSHSLLNAFLTTPREEFVAEDIKPLAYIDNDIKISSAPRYLLEPSPLAKLLQAADVSDTDNVLEIGTGSGYVSAVLSRLANKVYSVEVDPELASMAKLVLSHHNCDNVEIIIQSLSSGYKAGAPYDIIFINGAIETEPEGLFTQMKEGGRMIAVIGYGGAAKALMYHKENGAVSSRKLFNSSIPMIPGFERASEFVF